MKPDTSACWSSAIRGYCSLFNALVNEYKMNGTQVSSKPGARYDLKRLVPPGACTELKCHCSETHHEWVCWQIQSSQTKLSILE
jgi:hypothetical protein